MSELVDHPGRLGDLAGVFFRRRIAMAADGAGQLVLVRPDSVVIDTGPDGSRFDAVARVVDRRFRRQGGRRLLTPRGRGGLSMLTLPGTEPEEIADERRWGVTSVREALSTVRDGGLTADANYVVLGSQIVRASAVGTEAHFVGGMMFTSDLVQTDVGPVLRSTSEPAEPPAELRARLNLRNRRRPQVLILDTGLRTVDGKGRRVEHPALSSVRLHQPWLRDPQPGAIDDEDEYDDDASGTLDFEAGHGTFIAGLIQQICPDAEIHTAGALSSFGDGDVAAVVAAFERAFSFTDRYDIVIMSFGAYMADDDGAVFGTALSRLLGDAVAVAAAGNQSTSRPYFPAALPAVVGVGALGENDKAWFTNFGGWVDACAPGVDVISTFFTGDPPFLDEPPFTGWARLSGTSVAAPKVAGVIAQEMYLSRSTAEDTWRRLSNYQRHRFPDLGTVFNV